MCYSSHVQTQLRHIYAHTCARHTYFGSLGTHNKETRKWPNFQNTIGVRESSKVSYLCYKKSKKVHMENLVIYQLCQRFKLLHRFAYGSDYLVPSGHTGLAA